LMGNNIFHASVFYYIRSNNNYVKATQIIIFIFIIILILILIIIIITAGLSIIISTISVALM
ncbi:MAG TPA: hypothetical protein VGE97_07015, partial [Nitrososphaera sp.]